MPDDAKRMADLYISRGCGSPRPSHEEITSDIQTVTQLLRWHDEDELYGGIVLMKPMMRPAGEACNAPVAIA